MMSGFCDNVSRGVPLRALPHNDGADQKRPPGEDGGDRKEGVLAPSVTVTWARQSSQPDLFAVKETIDKQMSRVSKCVCHYTIYCTWYRAVSRPKQQTLVEFVLVRTGIPPYQCGTALLNDVPHFDNTHPAGWIFFNLIVLATGKKSTNVRTPSAASSTYGKISTTHYKTTIFVVSLEKIDAEIHPVYIYSLLCTAAVLVLPYCNRK